MGWALEKGVSNIRTIIPVFGNAGWEETSPPHRAPLRRPPKWRQIGPVLSGTAWERAEGTFLGTIRPEGNETSKVKVGETKRKDMN